MLSPQNRAVHSDNRCDEQKRHGRLKAGPINLLNGVLIEHDRRKQHIDIHKECDIEIRKQLIESHAEKQHAQAIKHRISQRIGNPELRHDCEIRGIPNDLRERRAAKLSQP